MTNQAVRVVMSDTEGRALLHLRRDDQGKYVFCFFGGKVEADEVPEVAAARELDEELGLKIEAGQLHYLASWHTNHGVEVLHYKLEQPVSWKDLNFGEKYGIAMVPYSDLPSIPLAESMRWFYQEYPKQP